MKFWKPVLLTCACILPSLMVAQSIQLSEAWKDPQFVKQFTGSFLPVTELEPKISEAESTLFQELSELLAANQTEQAISRLAQAVAQAPADSPVSAALNYTLANLYLQDGKFDRAIAQYQTAIGKFPNFRRAIKNLGLAYIQSEQYDKAIGSLVKAIELGDGAGDTFGLLAYSYLNEGNPTAALEGYRQATLLNPGNREWRIGKAEALMRTDRYEEAIAEFKQLLKELPERDVFYTSIANAYLSLNDSKTAGHYLEILRRQGEAKPSALGLLGDIYVNESLPRLALIAYTDAVQSGGFSESRSLRALRALLARGYYEEAEAFLNNMEGVEALTFSGDQSRDILNLKAQLALARGEDEEAAGILEEVLEDDPLNGNALMLLGDYHSGQGDLESAVYYYERAVALSDYQRDAQIQLARIYVQQKEYLKAIRELESAQQLNYSSNVQDFLDAIRSVYNRSL